MSDRCDAVEWAARLPWADRNVGTTEQSYLGATQYLLAPGRLPHLKATFLVSAAVDFQQRWVYYTGGPSSSAGRLPTPFSWRATRWNGRD
jgi:predicted acyl esterase